MLPVACYPSRRWPLLSPSFRRIVAFHLYLSLFLFLCSRSRSISISVESDFVVRSTPSTSISISVALPILFVSLLRSLARFLASTLSVLVPRYFYLSFPTQKFAVSSSPPSESDFICSLAASACRALSSSLTGISAVSLAHPTASLAAFVVYRPPALFLFLFAVVYAAVPFSLSLSLARRTFVSSASLLRILSFSHARHIRVVLTCRSFVLCRILLRSDSVSASLVSLVSSPPCVYIDCFCLSRAIILLSDVSFLPPRTYRCLFSRLLGALLSHRLSFLYRAGVVFTGSVCTRRLLTTFFLSTSSFGHSIQSVPKS